MKIVRIWLYKQFVRPREITFPKGTNEEITTVVRGDFKYYAMEGNKVRESSRKEADKWASETGHKVETLRGYPAFMHDLGYRA